MQDLQHGRYVRTFVQQADANQGVSEPAPEPDTRVSLCTNTTEWMCSFSFTKPAYTSAVLYQRVPVQTLHYGTWSFNGLWPRIHRPDTTLDLWIGHNFWCLMFPAACWHLHPLTSNAVGQQSDRDKGFSQLAGANQCNTFAYKTKQMASSRFWCLKELINSFGRPKSQTERINSFRLQNKNGGEVHRSQSTLERCRWHRVLRCSGCFDF